MRPGQTVFRQTATAKPPSPAARPRRASAFTLIEVLLAITITGFVLAAASTMLVSVSNIWSKRQEINFFDDHVDGVTEFIQACFANAGLAVSLSSTDDAGNNDPSDEGSDLNNGGRQVTPFQSNDRGNNTPRTNTQRTTSGSLLRVSDEPVSWAKLPGAAAFQDPLLRFKLKDQPPLLVDTDNAPVTGIEAFIYFNRSEGLSLLWHSLLQEEVEDENDLRRTQISPYVTQLRYIYWDERFERWEEEEEPQEDENDAFLLPRFIKLVFEHEGVTKERTISVPIVSRSALIF